MAKDKKVKKGDKKKEVAAVPEKKGKSKKEKKSSSSAETVMTKYSGSIALTKLKHVVMNKKGKKGKKITGLFIPVKENYLVPGKDGAYYLSVNIVTKTPQDDYGQNGFVSQNGNKKWSECSEKEKNAFKALPILGNIKNFDDSQSTSQADTSGAASSAIDEEDDLPF
jgi:hypothetical protein